MGDSNCAMNWSVGAACVTAFFALSAFSLSVYEYWRHKKRYRANTLSRFNERYMVDSDIRTVVIYLEALEDNKEASLGLPNIHQLEVYMRFFEEICILIRSSALKRNIVYYMFGHYVIVFDDNKSKWPKELEYEKPFWKVFRDFVEMMKKAKKEIYLNHECININKIKI